MITGKFLTSNADITVALAMRDEVFPGVGRDERDAMAIYAVTFSEAGEPGSAGRLYMDDDNVIAIDCVGTVERLRGQGLGDLVMRMLLYRVLEMNLDRVKLSCAPDLAPFFMRYGFRTTAQAGESLIQMQAENAEINIEGTCKHCAEAR